MQYNWRFIQEGEGLYPKRKERLLGNKFISMKKGDTCPLKVLGSTPPPSLPPPSPPHTNTLILLLAPNLDEVSLNMNIQLWLPLE